MTQDERDFILQSSRRVEWQENAPRPLDDTYCDMTPSELIRLVETLQQMLRESQAARKESEAARKEADLRNDELLARLGRMEESIRTLMADQQEKDGKLAEKDKKIAELQQTIKDRDARINLDNQERFGSKSQKGKTKPKAKPDRTRQQDKDDFDGTSGSIPAAEEDPEKDQSADKPERTQAQRMADMLRKGTTYRKMKASNKVVHATDMSRLPAGAEVIRKVRKYFYEEVTTITEHEYEEVIYKLGDTLVTAYLPAEGEPEIIDCVPGTHASSEMLAHLAFNRFVLDTPLYREIGRLNDEGMHLSRKTLTNWLHKGSLLLAPMVEQLKKIAVEKDSIVNCDETWCRVKVFDKYRKRYIWCLVNKEARIVIYCYEDGSRGRDALKLILGDAELKALQSDGYNVYLYLDNELSDIDHICCLAHARAKFRYALDGGDEADSRYILDCIGELYALEAKYQKEGWSPEKIGVARKSVQTLEIIGRLRSKLNVLLAPDHPPRGALLDKAVTYLDTFWKQIFRYTDDGRYSIDNNIAERNIRPLAGERKNSLFFGSHKMARASAIFHTAIATCRMMGLSAMDYFKTFFRRIVEGVADYTQLMPQTIGISANKC